MIILAMDPSGSFNEGKGTSGYSIWAYNDMQYKLLNVGQLSALEYETQQDYWQAHINLLRDIKPDILVIEDYLLYAHKAMQQTGSKMETPKLIGIIQYECSKLNIQVELQKAVDVKNRWTDDILVYKGILIKEGNHYNTGQKKKVSRHIRDSIRHGIHYIMKVRNKEWKKKQ